MKFMAYHWNPNRTRAERPPPAGKIYNPKRPTRAEKMWRTMEILLKNVAYNGNPPPAGKIYNPNPPTRADPRRSSAAGRENQRSKSARAGRAGNPQSKSRPGPIRRRRPRKFTIQIPTRADLPPPAEKIHNPNPLVLCCVVVVATRESRRCRQKDC